MAQIIYWHIINNQRVRDEFTKQINNYLLSNSRDTKYDVERLNQLWVGYVIDSQFPMTAELQKNINKELYTNISNVLNISSAAVSSAITVAKSIVSLKQINVDVNWANNGDILSIGELNLDIPDQVIVDDNVVEQLLRYRLIEGYIEDNRSYMLPNSIEVCQNTLIGNKCAGMYLKDIDTLGNPITYIKSLKEVVDLTVYLPASTRYSKQLLTLVEQYVKKYPRAEVVCVANIPNLSSKSLIIHTIGNLTIFTNQQKHVDRYTEELRSSMHPYPYQKKQISSFTKMVHNILKNVNDPVNQFKWSVSTRGCDLGMMSRSYPNDYNTMDSISNWFAEDVRIDCKNKNDTMSPRETWYHLITTNPDIINQSYENQNMAIRSLTAGCTVFNAGLSAYLLNRFVGGGKLLDPSAGWGERMITHIITGGTEYVAWDPNTRLQKVHSLEAMATNYVMKSNTKVIVYPKPFEDDLEMFDNQYKEYFDGCLMSPPFFDLELYLGSQTSTTRYTEFNKWVEGFYKPMLLACYSGLKFGAYLMAYIPGSWFYKHGKPFDKLPELSQMLPHARVILESVGAEYCGVFGYTLGDPTNPNDSKLRETFIWRKPLYKVSANSWKKGDTLLLHHNDSDQIVGTFTSGIPHFATYVGKKVYVINNYPTFDTEVICYGCSQYNIECVIVSKIEYKYELNQYGAQWLIVDSIDMFKPPEDNAVVINDGCNIPELLELTAKNINIDGMEGKIYLFDSPGVVALLNMILPNNRKMVVTCRDDIKYGIYENVTYNRCSQGLFESANMMPDYHAHSMFDAKIYEMYQSTYHHRIIIWINK